MNSAKSINFWNWLICGKIEIFLRDQLWMALEQSTSSKRHLMHWDRGICKLNWLFERNLLRRKFVNKSLSAFPRWMSLSTSLNLIKSASASSLQKSKQSSVTFFSSIFYPFSLCSFTEKHKNVYSLSLSCCDLTSLQNFPVLPNLIRVFSKFSHNISKQNGFFASSWNLSGINFRGLIWSTCNV